VANPKKSRKKLKHLLRILKIKNRK